MKASREIVIVYHRFSSGAPMVHVTCNDVQDLGQRIQAAYKLKKITALLVVWIDGVPDHSYLIDKTQTNNAQTHHPL